MEKFPYIFTKIVNGAFSAVYLSEIITILNFALFLFVNIYRLKYK